MFQEVLTGSLKGLCVLAYRFASEPAPVFPPPPLTRRTPEPKLCQTQEPHATRRAGYDCPAPRGSGSLTPNKKRFTGFIEYSPGAALIRTIFTDLFGKILILPNLQKAKILIYQCFPPFASLFTASNGLIAIAAPHRYAATESIKRPITDAVRNDFQLFCIYVDRGLIHVAAILRLLKSKYRDRCRLWIVVRLLQKPILPVGY